MSLDETVDAVANAASWDARIALVRHIPEQFGTAAHQAVYSAIARQVYLPSLAPDFAYVHWHEDYELPLAQHTYDLAFALTEGFTRVTLHDLVRTITSEPTTLRVFRLILGFTAQEFAAATVLVGNSEEEKALTVGSYSRSLRVSVGPVPLTPLGRWFATPMDERSRFRPYKKC